MKLCINKNKFQLQRQQYSLELRNVGSGRSYISTMNTGDTVTMHRGIRSGVVVSIRCSTAKHN